MANTIVYVVIHTYTRTVSIISTYTLTQFTKIITFPIVQKEHTCLPQTYTNIILVNTRGTLYSLQYLNIEFNQRIMKIR